MSEATPAAIACMVPVLVCHQMPKNGTLRITLLGDLTDVHSWIVARSLNGPLVGGE